MLGETTGERAVIEVHGRKVAIAKRFLEVRTDRPSSFTVVIRSPEEPNPARDTPIDLGRTYVVCPKCATRNPVSGRAPMLTCVTCRHRGEVAWWESG
jgi:hypothetical protein